MIKEISTELLALFLQLLVDFLKIELLEIRAQGEVWSLPRVLHCDYIVVGAVVASRLSDSKDQHVLLLEAVGLESLSQNILQLNKQLSETPIDWVYEFKPLKHTCFGLNERKEGARL